MRIVKEHFDSIHKLLNTMNTRPNNSEMKGRNDSHEVDFDFAKTKNWNHAVELFQNGYIDVLQEIKFGLSRNLKATQTANRRNVRTGVIGYAPHVPNAILNLPNSMIYTECQPQKIKAVSLFYCPTENCNVKADTFIKSGICMLSAINMLELSGVRVNLNIVFFNGTNSGDSEGVFATVKVKDFKEHMDIQKLCFPVVHPSLFRRFGFKWLETSPDIQCSGWKSGYGHKNKKFDDDMKKAMNENEYLITMDDTKESNYTPEELIKKLNIKK